MPGITEALNAAPYRGGVTLLVPKLLDRMPPELRSAAEALLASEHSDRFVADAFTDDGYGLSQNAVRQYRKINRLHRFA